MTDIQLYTKLNYLTPSLKNEVYDFIEFLLSKQQNNKQKFNKPKFGCAKGRFKMSPDFNEPLEDFKDYME
jgi:hypothetical protein